jgi:hypothetical protein
VPSKLTLNVPVVILLVSRFGISDATNDVPAVTIPLVVTVSLGYVPAARPD